MMVSPAIDRRSAQLLGPSREGKDRSAAATVTRILACHPGIVYRFCRFN
jgi:hypothetical protein